MEEKITNRRGIEFALLQVEPGLWQWQFRIGETVRTGKTKTKLKEMAARRVQQRIDRELKKLRDLGQTIDHLPKPRRPREKRIVPLTRVTYSLAEFCEKTGLSEKAVLRAIMIA